MASKAIDLFEAYEQDKLPRDEAYIVSSFFSSNTTYSKYEIVSYSAVKAIFRTDEGLTFQSNGKKIYVLIEPAGYPNKSVEPYIRTSSDQVPLRFSEMTILTAKNQSRVMVSKNAVQSYSSFTVMRPSGINFALLFYKLPDVFDTMQIFFEKTFNKEAAVPQHDAQKVAKTVIDEVRTEMVW
jgi:hypothetical protein